ncbi:hypothetical protein KBD59_05955 [Candidatus Gracilibacteria bacterium]|nr:hypothetical protein [Candidatus Gracilibacteria bacterium]
MATPTPGENAPAPKSDGTLEMGKKSKTQAEMIPLTAAMKKLDFRQINIPETKITADKDSNTLNRALDKAFADYYRGLGSDPGAAKVAVAKYRNAVVGYLRNAGMDVNKMFAGDSFSISNNRLTFNTKTGETYNVSLDGKEADSNIVWLNKRGQIKDASRREWTTLEEAFKSKILVNPEAGLGIKSVPKNRQQMWEYMREAGTDLINTLKEKNADPRLLAELEKNPDFLKKAYKGTAMQNLAIIQYLELHGLREHGVGEDLPSIGEVVDAIDKETKVGKAEKPAQAPDRSTGRVDPATDTPRARIERATGGNHREEHEVTPRSGHNLSEHLKDIGEHKDGETVMLDGNTYDTYTFDSYKVNVRINENEGGIYTYRYFTVLPGGFKLTREALSAKAIRDVVKEKTDSANSNHARLQTEFSNAQYKEYGFGEATEKDNKLTVQSPDGGYRVVISSYPDSKSGKYEVTVSRIQDPQNTTKTFNDSDLGQVLKGLDVALAEISREKLDSPADNIARARELFPQPTVTDAKENPDGSQKLTIFRPNDRYIANINLYKTNGRYEATLMSPVGSPYHASDESMRGLLVKVKVQMGDYDRPSTEPAAPRVEPEIPADNGKTTVEIEVGEPKPPKPLEAPVPAPAPGTQAAVETPVAPVAPVAPTEAETAAENAKKVDVLYKALLKEKALIPSSNEGTLSPDGTQRTRNFDVKIGKGKDEVITGKTITITPNGYSFAFDRFPLPLDQRKVENVATPQDVVRIMKERNDTIVRGNHELSTALNTSWTQATGLEASTPLIADINNTFNVRLGGDVNSPDGERYLIKAEYDGFGKEVDISIRKTTGSPLDSFFKAPAKARFKETPKAEDLKEFVDAVRNFETLSNRVNVLRGFDGEDMGDYRAKIDYIRGESTQYPLLNVQSIVSENVGGIKKEEKVYKSNAIEVRPDGYVLRSDPSITFATVEKVWEFVAPPAAPAAPTGKEGIKPFDILFPNINKEILWDETWEKEKTPGEKVSMIDRALSASELLKLGFVVPGELKQETKMEITDYYEVKNTKTDQKIIFYLSGSLTGIVIALAGGKQIDLGNLDAPNIEGVVQLLANKLDTTKPSIEQTAPQYEGNLDATETGKFKTRLLSALGAIPSIKFKTEATEKTDENGLRYLEVESVDGKYIVQVTLAKSKGLDNYPTPLFYKGYLLTKENVVSKDTYNWYFDEDINNIPMRIAEGASNKKK